MFNYSIWLIVVCIDFFIDPWWQWLLAIVLYIVVDFFVVIVVIMAITSFSLFGRLWQAVEDQGFSNLAVLHYLEKEPFVLPGKPTPCPWDNNARADCWIFVFVIYFDGSFIRLPYANEPLLFTTNF